jgi:hypothetical protein
MAVDEGIGDETAPDGCGSPCLVVSKVGDETESEHIAAAMAPEDDIGIDMEMM